MATQQLARPLDHLSDGVIIATVGSRSATHGARYAVAGRVQQLQADPAGLVLTGSVRGSRAKPYDVVVCGAGNHRGAVRWVGRCTCPVGLNCKHVAALMVAARSAAQGRLIRSTPSWEASLDALLRPPATTADPQPLALQLEVGGRGQLLARPLTLSPSGRWVRGGVSWRELEYGYVRGHHPARQLDVLRELLAVHLSRCPGYGGMGPTVDLGAVGPSLWPLLARGVSAGLALTGAGAVTLAGPAVLNLDLTADGAGGARLAPRVQVDGRELDPASVVLVGDPPHGLYLADGATLVLAPLDARAAEPVVRMLGGPGPLTVPADDLGRFLERYHRRLHRLAEITSSDGSIAIPTVADPRLAVTVTYGERLTVDVELGFAYDDELVGLHAGDDDPLGLRDPDAERALLDALALPELAPHAHLDGMDAVDLHVRVLPALLAHDDVDVTLLGTAPEFRRATDAPQVHLSTTDTPDNDWFDLAVTVTVDGEDIPFDELFRALAVGATEMVLPSGTYFSLERPELERLRELIEEARTLTDRPSNGLRLSVFQAGLWEELRALGVVEAQSRRWAQAVQGLLGLDELPPAAAPVTLDAHLRLYQQEGYRWLRFLQEHSLGGVLADDMGLGKTVQTLAMMCHAWETQELDGPFLVVAPTSVVANWAAEAARFAPQLKVAAVTETVGKRRTPLAEDIAGADVVITSYALFRIDFDHYDAQPWAGLILDEAQFVKNHQAKSYQCARRLGTPFKLAVTGTPLENSLMDLWSLLSIVAPGLFPSPERFTETYRRPIERGDDRERLATLRQRIRPLMLRRTKEQVTAELPPKQEQVLHVTLNPAHRKLYNTHLQRERQKVLGLLADIQANRFAIFSSLTLLRRLALDPALIDDAYAGVSASKTDAFMTQLHSVVAEGHRALVFSQFTGFLAGVRARLDAEGVRYSYLDGSTRKRGQVVQRFKSGDDPVFLISLKAGGVGLNLTEADYCFVLDPWWNPAVEAQAIDRTHRIGQDKPVMVYRLVADDTIEEKVMALKARKQGLFDRVVDDDAMMAAPLTAADIRGLFS